VSERDGQPQGTLAVDLDGTLIRTDILHETFWSALGRRWSVPVDAALRLAHGRAQMKRHLAQLSSLDISLLPYNEQVIAYIRRWRDGGGRTALVTACDQILAERIAAHLGIFDEVYGSDGLTNLKGERKAELLVERFGENGFVYMGDAMADLSVWARASRAIAVNPTSMLKTRLSAIGRQVEHLTSSAASPKAYFEAMRPHQWLKNLLVFVPMLAAHQLSLDALVPSLLAFIVFSVVASSVYIVNDLVDLEADRAHPRKCRRPIASGALPIAHATWLAPALFVVGMGLGALLGLEFALVMIGYYLATLAYSLHLKRRMLVDIFMLAGLYTMRIVAGGAATTIPLSVWLLAFSIFFFFSLAAIKRQAELIDGVAAGEISTRGRGYQAADLPLVAIMATASGYVSVLVMALYVNSPTTTTFYSQPAALWGICLVIFYWISRMEMVTHRGGMHDDPIVFAVRDRISLICAAAILVLAVGGSIL
jgi:4-hydroxybenzoate polyprenyltransferase/phosphoserine phosphatase